MTSPRAACFSLLLAGGFFAASTLAAAAAIERTVEKTFPVTGSGLLTVDTQGGGIRVKTTTEPGVKVTARQRIKADTEAEADALLRKLELTLEQRGNDVRVVAKYPSRPLGLNFGSWPPVRVDFEVAVPAGFAAELATSGGGIEVGDLAGNVQARTSGGSIALGRMGGEVKARTSGGNIVLGSAAGAVELNTSGGNVTAGPVSGPATLGTSGGNIAIDGAAGVLRARTSGGSIRAKLIGPLMDDCSLSTSGGSVRVTVDRAATFRLDASASGGKVDVAGLKLTLEKFSTGRNRVTGEVNGGGRTLKLRSSGGGVAVQSE
jgi:hypothetical protein